MTTLLPTEFLYAIATAIVHSFWQMATIYALYRLTTFLAQPTASKKYYLALAGTLAGTVLFVATFMYSFTATKSISTMGWASIPLKLDAHQICYYLSNFLYQLLPYISLAYLATAFLLSIRLFRSFTAMRQWLLPQAINKASLDCRLYVNKYSQLLGIKRPVQVFYSRHMSSPLTVGFWKPLILLPLATINHLSVAQVEALLLHELAHIRRHDYLFNYIFQVASIFLFFNPFMRLLLQRAYAEREHSCDDWVLQFNYNGKEYAQALLSIEQQAAAPRLALYAAKSTATFYLLHRIARIVGTTNTGSYSKANYGMTLAGILGVFFLTFLFTTPTFRVQRPTPIAFDAEQHKLDLNTIKIENEQWIGQIGAKKTAGKIEKGIVAARNTSPVTSRSKKVKTNTGLSHSSALNSKTISTKKQRHASGSNTTWSEIGPQLARILTYQTVAIQQEKILLQEALIARQSAVLAPVAFRVYDAEDNPTVLPNSLTENDEPIAGQAFLEKTDFPQTEFGLKIAVEIKEKDTEELTRALQQILKSLHAEKPEEVRSTILGKATFRKVPKRIIIQL